MQPELFIETLSEALTDLVNQLGGAKKVGGMFWPEKTMDKARGKLLDCLNPDHSQKFSLEQIDFLIEEARKQNVHTMPAYIGYKCGGKWIPVEPEDELAQLQRDYISATKTMKTLTDRIEKTQMRVVGQA